MQLVPGTLDALRLQEQLHTKYAEFTDRGWDAKVLVKGLDVEGVDISVIYGPLYSMWADGMDPRFAAALARAYNRWLADYSADSGGRILGAAPLPIQDLDLALAELDYCYDTLGIKAVLGPAQPGQRARARRSGLRPSLRRPAGAGRTLFLCTRGWVRSCPRREPTASTPGPSSTRAATPWSSRWRCCR